MTSDVCCQCLSCANNPECASDHAPGTMVSCAEVAGQDSYCYVYIQEDNTVMKGCLEYGAERPDIMTSVWPEDMKCVTVLDGESKGGLENPCNFSLNIVSTKEFQMVTAASVSWKAVILIFVRRLILTTLLMGM